MTKEQLSQERLNEALRQACLYGNLEKAEQSINDGANVNAKDEDGDTPLHCAAYNYWSADNGHMIEKYIIEKDAVVYVDSKSDYTEIVKLLIEKGAIVDAKNKYGETPLDVATSSGHTEIVELLEQAMKEKE